jgi:maltodextrin utilization protein YvdJ
MDDVGASASVRIKGAKKLLIFLVALSILPFTFSFSERSTFYKMSAPQNTYEH